MFTGGTGSESEEYRPLITRGHSVVEIMPDEPTWLKNLGELSFTLGRSEARFDQPRRPLADIPDDKTKQRLQASAITGSETDHLRAALSQARIRLEALNLLYDCLGTTKAEQIIRYVLTALAKQFSFGPFTVTPAKIELDTLKKCQDLTHYIETLIQDAYREHKPKYKPKPTVLAAWWRQKRNALLKQGKTLAGFGHPDLRNLEEALYSCENAAIFAGNDLVDYKPEFSTDRTQVQRVTERVIGLSGSRTAVLANYFPVEPDWLLSEQVDEFIQIYQVITSTATGLLSNAEIEARLDELSRGRS